MRADGAACALSVPPYTQQLLPRPLCRASGAGGTAPRRSLLLKGGTDTASGRVSWALQTHSAAVSRDVPARSSGCTSCQPCRPLIAQSPVLSCTSELRVRQQGQPLRYLRGPAGDWAWRCAHSTGHPFPHRTLPPPGTQHPYFVSIRNFSPLNSYATLGPSWPDSVNSASMPHGEHRGAGWARRLHTNIRLGAAERPARRRGAVAQAPA